MTFALRPSAGGDKGDCLQRLRTTTTQLHGAIEGLLRLPKVPEFETFEKAVASANAWIAQEAIRVIHVETVVLPHAYIHDARDVSQTGQAILQASSLAFWEQFVRVWYEVE